MSDSAFESYYRDIFTDLKVDREESEDIIIKYRDANIPPDKLLALRSLAFRIGCEFLSDSTDSNTSLLRSINAVVHALETTRMLPKAQTKAWGEEVFDESKLESLYRKIFSDLVVDREENQELMAFFKDTPPPKSKLRWTRSSAFRIGSEFLSNDDKDKNTSLLRCINAVVHVFEINCLLPKSYTLNTKPFNMNASISEAVQHLWELDVNRATAGRDYKINVQSGKKPYKRADDCPDPLFTFVDTKNLFQRSTYKAFIALLDNYEAKTGVTEKVTSKESKENWAFLNAIMQTGPMQFCHKYCCANNSEVPSDADEFKNLLKKIWFDLYYRERGGGRDSSGFEHVFVGEIKNDQVTGFHNWIQYYLEEKKGTVDYKGYIKPRNRNSAETNADDNVLTLQFTWNGYEKFVGTDFIGVSPEFEMALYTMCFLVGKETNVVELNTGTDVFELIVKVFTMARNKIGTCYIEATGHFD